MAALGTRCEWDAAAGLLVVSFSEEDAPAAALFAVAERDGVVRFLGEIPAGERSAILRAPGDWSAFTLALFDETADPLTDLRRARTRLRFDAEAAYDPTVEESPERRTALRFFRPIATRRADRGARGIALEMLDGPEIADGAAPGVWLETLAAEHFATDGAEAFAAQATVRLQTQEGTVQGPAARAYPDPDEPLEARFGWMEEPYADLTDVLQLGGFESSRVPMVEIDLSRFGDHAPRVAQSFVFLHAPLTADGYAGGLDAVRGVVDPEEPHTLRHVWEWAQHRDLIGVVRRNGLRLRAVGELTGLPETPYEPDAPVGALYLGETLRPEPNDRSTEALGAQIAQALAQAEGVAHGFDEGEAAAAFGLTWAQGAAESPDLPTPLDIGGSAEAAPASVAAFIALAREALQTSGATRQALEGRFGLPFDFETFRREGDAIWAVTRFPDLAASALDSFVDRKLRDGPAPRRLAGAMHGLEEWWDGLGVSEAAHAWRLLRAGVDLKSFAARGFAVQSAPADAAAVNRALVAADEGSADDLERARRVAADLGREFRAADEAGSLSEALRRADAIAEARAALAEEAALLRDGLRAAQLPAPAEDQALWTRLARPMAPPPRGQALAETAGRNAPLRDLLRGLRVRSVRAEAYRILSEEKAAEEKLADFLGQLAQALFLPSAVARRRASLRREISALAELGASGKRPPDWRSPWAMQRRDEIKTAVHQHLQAAQHALDSAYLDDPAAKPSEAAEWMAAVQRGQDWIAARALWRDLRVMLDEATHNLPAGEATGARPALSAPPVSSSWRAREAAQIKRRMTAPLSTWPDVADAAETLLRPLETREAGARRTGPSARLLG